MKVLRQVKMSDHNYGNSTHQIELNVKAGNFVQTYGLLDEWEELIRNGAAVFDDEEVMTVKEAREMQQKKARFEFVLTALADMEEPLHYISEQ